MEGIFEMEDNRIFLKLRAYDPTGATSDSGMNQLFTYVDYAEILSVEPFNKDLRGVHSVLQLRDGINYYQVDNTPEEVMEEIMKASRLVGGKKQLNG